MLAPLTTLRPPKLFSTPWVARKASRVGCLIAASSRRRGRLGTPFITASLTGGGLRAAPRSGGVRGAPRAGGVGGGAAERGVGGGAGAGGVGGGTPRRCG